MTDVANIRRLLITKELLRNGYAPIVIPLEFRNEYMQLLAKSRYIRFSNNAKKTKQL